MRSTHGHLEQGRPRRRRPDAHRRWARDGARLRGRASISRRSPRSRSSTPMRAASGRVATSRDYLLLAADADTGFVLETPTWRANSDWGDQLGYSPTTCAASPRSRRRSHRAFARTATATAGCSSAAASGHAATATSPVDHHDRGRRPPTTTGRRCVTSPADGADLVTAFTLSYVDEAIGVVAAAAEAGSLRDGFHRRDRRSTAVGRVAGRGDRARRRRRPAPLLRGLWSTARTPTTYSRDCPPTTSRGYRGSARTAPMHLGLSHAELDEAERTRDGASRPTGTSPSATAFRRCAYSAAAAAPTSGT